VVTCPFGIIFLLTVVQQFSGMTILRAYIVKISNNIFSQSANINGESLIKKRFYQGYEGPLTKMAARQLTK